MFRIVSRYVYSDTFEVIDSAFSNTRCINDLPSIFCKGLFSNLVDPILDGIKIKVSDILNNSF